MSSESDVQLRDCLEHVMAMTTDDCYVKDGGWFGDGGDVLADVELL